MSLDPVLSRIDADIDASLERLMALLRIPSISTDPAYKEDVARAADWMAEDLRSLGADASVRPTAGHPMVVGHVDGPGPHLLFYGHYDVQPVDPLELWHRDPFDPAIEDTDKGRVMRGRGASDDKGQLMTFIEACRAWKAVHGALPCKITFLLEGEEESGSPSLVPFMEENADELRADIALICDTGMYDADTPAITTQLRGMVTEQIDLTCANRDLHSGLYGGMAANPIYILTKILAGLKDDSGRCTLPGFYDDVPELDPELKAQWDSLNFDPAQFLGEVGLSHPAGESDRTPLEMIWSRPTAEVNGIWGGYTGEGFKTVIPSQAHAKVSFRLVGQQDPDKISAAFRDYVRGAIPPDASVDFPLGKGAMAGHMNTDHPAYEKARDALSDEWNTQAVFVGMGGSIPIAGHFKTVLGMDALLVGYGNKDDQIHSPNEKYNLRSFHKGARSWARILDALTR